MLALAWMLKLEDDIPQASVAMYMNDIPNPNWNVDTGATAHMTTNSSNLPSITSLSRKDKIFIDDGAGLSISHMDNTVFPKYYPQSLYIMF